MILSSVALMISFALGVTLSSVAKENPMIPVVNNPCPEVLWGNKLIITAGERHTYCRSRCFAAISGSASKSSVSKFTSSRSSTAQI